MSLIKVVPYVLGLTPGVPGAPEPRMYSRSGYFLVSIYESISILKTIKKLRKLNNAVLCAAIAAESTQGSGLESSPKKCSNFRNLPGNSKFDELKPFLSHALEI